MGFIRYRLYPRVVNDLKKRSFIGIFFYFIVVDIILFAEGYYDRHPGFSKQFLFLITAVCLFRFLHLSIAKWIPSKFDNINKSTFVLSVVATALIWGIGFARFMTQDGEPNTKLLMVMCSIGLCSGGAVAYLPDLRLSVAFCFFMFGPAISSMVFHHINMPLVSALSLFLLYLCFIAYRGNREYWDALENEYLLEERSKNLEETSRIDDLTGLYNRRHFDEVFSFEWNRSVRDKTPISVIIGDVDQFKQINDEHGHAAGDEYLKEMALLLKRVFKRETDITARYRGEAFIILMPNSSSEDACRLAETIRSMTEFLHLEYGGKIIKTTISLGVATCIPQKKHTNQSLISQADKALFHSKTNGKNKVTDTG